jgi:hypothetical protein
MSIFALTPGALFGSLGKEHRSRPRAEPVSSFLTFGSETPDEPAGLGSATGEFYCFNMTFKTRV